VIAASVSIPFTYDQIVQIQMWLFPVSTILIMGSFVVFRWKTHKEDLEAEEDRKKHNLAV